MGAVSVPQLAGIALCVFALAVGQILFKLSARAVAGAQGVADLLRLLQHPWFILALAVYGAATLLWVWLLREIPLTVAYPFFALSFVLVPLLGWLLLGEVVGWTYWLGIALIMAGIYTTIR
jgi:drug/metabolite transporter (DMT)-like permease